MLKLDNMPDSTSEELENAIGLAVVESEDSAEMPELHKRGVGEMAAAYVRGHFKSSKPHLDEARPKLTLGDVARGVFSLLLAMVIAPFRWAGRAFGDVRDWWSATVEIQRAILRYRKRRRERIRNLSKIRTQTIIKLLEDDQHAFDKVRARLKGRELYRWWMLSIRWWWQSHLEMLVPSLRERRTRARSAERETQRKRNRKGLTDEEIEGKKGLRKFFGLFTDFWANAQRAQDAGLFVKRKDSRLKLSAKQWEKLEAVYRRAHVMMKQGNYDEALVALESCVDTLGKNTGDAIYYSLGNCKMYILQRDAPKKPTEWIRQMSGETAFCYQQAHWVNPAKKDYLRKATDAKAVESQWAANHRDLAIEVDKLGYELSEFEKKFPEDVGIATAKRELFSAKVTLTVFGYVDAERVVVQCRDVVARLKTHNRF